MNIPVDFFWSVVIVLLGGILYFVIKTFNKVDSHTMSISAILEEIGEQRVKCAATHKLLDEQINTLRSNVVTEINNTKENFNNVKENMEETLQLVFHNKDIQNIVNKNNLDKS
jgi:5-bromo-4-chloroindolyl phosphate hydrolysis protein